MAEGVFSGLSFIPMKDITIKKGSATFIRGFDQPEKLFDWMDNKPDSIGIAFVGRSNVGKSSLINSLFGQKTAKTSKTPGRTQQINVFEFTLEKFDSEKKFYLYDLPGYGHAKVSRAMLKNWNMLMDTFFRYLNDRTLIVNIQDARHPNQASDQQFYSYLNANNVEVYLAFNKIDKLKKQKERSALNKLKPQLFKEFKSVKQMFFVSAEKKDNLEALNLSLVNYLLKTIDSF